MIMTVHYETDRTWPGLAIQIGATIYGIWIFDNYTSIDVGTSLTYGTEGYFTLLGTDHELQVKADRRFLDREQRRHRLQEIVLDPETFLMEHLL